MASPCVHELFEAQVIRTPDAVAVLADETTGLVELTYAQLNARANRMAHWLRSLGIGPENRVGVCLHRGADMVVTLLAVLKAGGAYVPLDPDYPTDRLAYMLTDSGASLVVTSLSLAPTVGAHDGVTVHVEDEIPAASDNPVASAHPDNPAYVMYTSGSTGRPKGVVVPHAGVVNRILWGQRWFGFEAGERLLQKTPYSFDVSVPELFGPLAAGATVVMARPGAHRDPAYLARVLRELDIATVHFVPSMLRIFLAEPFGPMPSLRRMMCSGEALSADLVAAVHARLDCELYNLYGPTETSIEVTATRCHPDQPLTIGHAVDNTTAHVLDADLKPVPDLVEGQLCIAGVQVTRGYHNRPGLTAERFVPDPHATEQGGRLYLTGDLVRRLPDGSIDYLGRIDSQVKIRGNRVELGEIESELVADDTVSAAVVTVDTANGGQRLVAYLVPAGLGGVDVGALRAQLAKRLPDYMIPTAWMVIEELPLTSSGKTDLKALPHPGSGRPDLATAFIAPRTKVEEALVEIWEGVLGLAPVGVRDGFLDLGGQSLAATRVCTQVRQVFGHDLSIDDLLTSSTVERVAGIVKSADPAGGRVDDRDAVASSNTGSGPLSFAQRGIWLAEQLAPGSADYNLFESYRVRGELDEAALRLALADTVNRHPALRTTFDERDGLPYQSIAESIPTPFGSITLPDGDPEAEARAVIDRESRRRFSLERGPLLRMTSMRLGEGHHVVLVVIHHIVSDDWSLEVFWRDLAAFYRARTTGSQPDVTPLATRYVDHSARQLELLRGPTRAVHLDYWRTQLEGAPLVFGLPPDHPRGRAGSSDDAAVAFALPANTSSALSDLARRSGSTPFMTLLAGFTATMSLAGAADDFLVGTFAGNRAAVEVEDLVGLFVNTLALRMRCTGNPTFMELLGRVRATALGAYRHQEMPFDQLVTAMSPQRDATRNPLVQVAFQTLGPRAGRLSLPGATCVPMRAGQGGNTFDVLTIVRENGDHLDGELHYRSDLFTEASAHALADGLVRVITTLIAEPDRRLSTVAHLVHRG